MSPGARDRRPTVPPTPITLGEPLDNDSLPSNSTTADDDNTSNEMSSGPNSTTEKAIYETGGLKLAYTSPRLNKKNYVDWVAKTENLLDVQGVWTIVNRDKQKPGDQATPEA